MSRKWQPTPIFLPRKFHGQRSLTGFSPWGHKEIGLSAPIHTERNSDLENCVLKKLVPLFFLKAFNIFNHIKKRAYNLHSVSGVHWGTVRMPPGWQTIHRNTGSYMRLKEQEL